MPTNLVRFAGVFGYCENLKTVNLNMEDIKLTSLESEFSVANLFVGCKSLTTIICDQDLSKYDTGEGYCSYIFDGCENLEGGQGTRYTDDHISAEYARPDDIAGGKPGYFTGEVVPPDAYACLDGNTLTFYYDYDKSSRTGRTWDLNTGAAKPGWAERSDYFMAIQKVVFDSSFKDCQPTSCYYWFYQCNNLKTGENMNYLNTSKVTHMTYMFFQCMSVSTLDFSSFDVSNVVDMNQMLKGCSSLTTIYSDKDWSQNEKIVKENVFYGCSKLVGGQGTTYQDSKYIGLYARPDKAQAGGNEGYFTSSSSNYAASTENTSTTSNEKSASASSDETVGLNNTEPAEGNSSYSSTAESEEQSKFEQANANSNAESVNTTKTESANPENTSVADEFSAACLSLLNFTSILARFATFGLI